MRVYNNVLARYTDTQCINWGIDRALAAYRTHIHDHVIERSVWRRVILYATSMARACKRRRSSIL